MNYHITETKLNNKKANSRKRLISSLAAITLISLLIIAPTTISSVSASPEPTLETILNYLGYTNIAISDTETFPAGSYNITLFAEFAGYYYQNVLSYYEVGTSDHQTIFTGPEGKTYLQEGYVVPPLSKTFASSTQFGLSMLTPQYRYFTEHYLNPDSEPDSPEQHARVYKNSNNPNMFLIGFENCFGGGIDRDYNDMVFSLVLTSSPPEIVSVTRAPENPNYDQTVTVTAQVAKGTYDIDTVTLSYQIGSGSWTNVDMNPESSAYVADIPSQPYGTTVNYKVYAYDTIGVSDSSAVYSYIVGDFVPPTISNVDQDPSTPNPNAAVTISAKVTEPSTASGVKNVTLWHKTTSAWSSVEMTLQDGLWTATIPGQTQGSTVRFFIEAFDNAENSGTTSTFSYSVRELNRPPTADFSSPSIVYTGEVVDVDASASYDADGYITSYSWDFGDGTTGSGVTASHSYVDDGEYTIMLTVTDNKGTSDTKTATITVQNRPPVADLTTSGATINKQETVTFDASPSYDPDGTIVAYSWNFGDGNTATGVSVSHSYENSNVYTVTLTVTDNDGAKDTTTATKTVTNQSPVAIFTESAETVDAEDSISFDATESYDPDGTIVIYTWDFGNGNTATGITTDHTYTQAGTYTVTLTVTDNDGATNTATATIKVVSNQSPVALFTASPETASTDDSVQFDASESYDPDGTIVSYTWDFGNGNTATGVTVDHAYEDNGVYTVTLTVMDDDGATDSTTAIITILNRSPVALFTESATTVAQEEAIEFDASESYDPDGTIVSYTWDFGNGNTATGITTDHTYTQAGTYTVTLTVTDNDGASSSAVVEITVEATVSLAVLSVIGLGITALTATLLYGLFIRRKKKKKSEDV